MKKSVENLKTSKITGGLRHPLKTRQKFETDRYPKRPYVRSGYIVLPKKEKKTTMLEKISQKLVSKRAKQSKQ